MLLSSPYIGDERKEKLLEQYSNYLKMRNYSRSTYKSYMSSKGKAAPSAIMNFAGTTFIHRFVQHILPPYFQRVRYFGLYAWAAKRKKDIAYQLISKQTPSPYEPPLERQLLKKMLGTDPDVCPECGAYQTLNAAPLVNTEKYYFKLKTKWHNVHIKLRQDDANFTA